MNCRARAPLQVPTNQLLARLHTSAAVGVVLQALHPEDHQNCMVLFFDLEVTSKHSKVMWLLLISAERRVEAGQPLKCEAQ